MTTITVDVLRHYLKCCDAGDVPDYAQAIYDYLRMDGYITVLNHVKPVGVVGTMPGTDGFTMAAFEASKVPVGTTLFAALKAEGESR